MKNIIVVLLAILFVSCGASKTTETKTETKIEHTSLKTNDSIVLKEINRAISDLVKIKVPVSKSNDKFLDSIVNARVDEILEKIDFKKTSGDNQYQILYNKLTRQIEASFKVGKTENTNSNVKKIEIDTKTDSHMIYEYTKKVKGLPFYWWILLIVFVFRKFIFGLLELLFPALRIFGVIKNMF